MDDAAPVNLRLLSAEVPRVIPCWRGQPSAGRWRDVERVIFLKTAQAEKGTARVLNLIETIQVLGNDLRRAVVVAVDQGQGYEVLYPAGFRGDFPV
jgi:hypothetical protein